MSAKEVATWMIDEMGASRWLYQETIVRKMKQTWGSDYVYTNQNGNLAIAKTVLKEFRKLTEDSLVWERGERAWRLRKPQETKRGVD